MVRRARSSFSTQSALTLAEVAIVVIVLLIAAALVLPALTPNYESDRKAVCASNLDQIGKAVETYLGTYGDYYPGGLGWWAVKPVPNDIKARFPNYVHAGQMWSGDYSARCGQVFTCENKRTKKLEQVAVNWQGSPDGGGLSNAQYDPTCVGCGTVGSMVYYPEVQVRARFPATGSKGLKMAPVGLGWLLYTDCLPDARALYCPAANDQQFRPSPSDRGQVGNWVLGDYKNPHNSWELCKHPRYDPTECNDYWRNETSAWDPTGPPFKSWGMDRVDDTLKAWYAAGGIDADTLVHGEWGRRASVFANTGFAVYSQYMYRNQPIGVTYASNHQSWDGSNVWGYYDCVSPFTVCFTSPAVTTTPGCPAFKTPRTLGNRALVSDSWEKSTVITKPGFEMQAHREKNGYNVLYGNYQTKWYPDPDGKIVYWSGRDGRLSPPLGATPWYTPGLGSTVTYWLAGQKECQGSVVNWGLHGLYASLDPLVWHQLDMNVDMDTNANVDLYDQRNGEADPPAPYSSKKPW